jgi:L-ascorbate metabolism protein UlaG (beta-lactamase superfamily)
MKLQLLRHATVFLQYAGIHFLLDPCLDPKGSQPAIPSKKGVRKRNNPLQDLPLSDEALAERFESLDFILLTHLHKDHFSGLSRFPELSEKTILAPEYAVPKLRSQGFQDVLPLKEGCRYRKVTIRPLPLRHGNWLQRAFLGKSHGFYLTARDEPPLLLTGDAIWDQSLQNALDDYAPQVILANAGAASLPFGGAITLDSQGIREILERSQAQVVAVHFDSYNHCRETRDFVRDKLSHTPRSHALHIPADGEIWESPGLGQNL